MSVSERSASVVKEGTLTKRAVSATFFKTWRSRRIVLVRSDSCTAIEWYRPDESEPAGTLDIDHRTQVSKQGRNLLVRSSGKELYLYHRDAAELAAWEAAITSCVPQAPQEAPSSSAAPLAAHLQPAAAPLPAEAPAEEPAASPAEAPPSAAPPDFPLTTPMLVAPWDKFRAQGRIEKNVAEWREKAFKEGLLVEWREDMIIFFISQRWWWIPPNRPPETCALRPETPCVPLQLRTPVPTPARHTGTIGARRTSRKGRRKTSSTT